MSQPAPVHCWCRILREAGNDDAKCGPCLVRENTALKARLAAQEHLNEQAVKAALHASQARLYPDAAYEKYLDELSVSLADLVGDAEPDSLDDAALRQAADAISHLRRTRDELRRDLNNVALAALPPSSPAQPTTEKALIRRLAAEIVLHVRRGVWHTTEVEQVISDGILDRMVFQTPTPPRPAQEQKWCPHCGVFGGHDAACEYERLAPPSSPVADSPTREEVLALAYRVSNVANGNGGQAIDPDHDEAACETCGQIADMLMGFFKASAPSPSAGAAPTMHELAEGLRQKAESEEPK